MRKLPAELVTAILAGFCVPASAQADAFTQYYHVACLPSGNFIIEYNPLRGVAHAEKDMQSRMIAQGYFSVSRRGTCRKNGHTISWEVRTTAPTITGPRGALSFMYATVSIGDRKVLEDMPITEDQARELYFNKIEVVLDYKPGEHEVWLQGEWADSTFEELRVKPESYFELKPDTLPLTEDTLKTHFTDCYQSDAPCTQKNILFTVREDS